MSTIRVSERTRDLLAKLATESGRSMTELLEEAAEVLERRVFFDQFAARYQQLRSDPAAWGEIEAERAIEGGAVGPA